jgi:UDP-N-acetylglucosamine 2-epimerase (hydrolysing)
MISSAGKELTGKRLLFVTGTRADYGKLEPLARAAYDAGFHISFFITGMHMMKRYGETRQEVKRFAGAEFFEFVNQREGDALDFIMSKTILGFSDFVHEHRPDLVIIHGDRVEALAASIVCAMRYIRSAHVEGGEVSGTIDESIRHCNTKLCTTHFVSSESAKARVLALGESSDRVFNIGSPELDTHAGPSGVSIEEVKAHYAIPFGEYGIAVFHPVTSEIDTIGAQASALFNALEASDKCFVVIAPNNDPGTEEIFAVLEKLPSDRFRLISSMRFNYFSELMKNAAVMVGNSSAGVREAPFIGLPSLDIGTRQKNRSVSKDVTILSAHDQRQIINWVKEKWNISHQVCSGYGEGSAAEKFVSILNNSALFSLSMQKIYAEI